MGGNEAYVSLCRKHFRSATGDRDGCGLGLPSPKGVATPSPKGVVPSPSGCEPKRPNEELPHHLGLGLPLPPLTPLALMPVAAPASLSEGVASRDSDRESPS